jgi:hypothetical protein
MYALLEDMQLEIIGYLLPNDVKTMYESHMKFEYMIHILTKY